MSPDETGASLVRRQRAVVIGGLAIIGVLAWAYTVHMAFDMAPMADMGMPPAAHWGPVEAMAALAMWSIMMIAMMVPSAGPMVLTYATLQARTSGGHDGIAVASFVIGYVVLWLAFSLIATVVQASLHAFAAISTVIGPLERPIGAAILILAGTYQFTPLKRLCLTHCRGPLQFISRHWRPGRLGAFAMGARHGAYCVGCCWPLMLLLFVTGVMNLLWIAALSVFVLLEKVLPFGEWLGRLGGAALIAWGFLLLI